MLHRIDQNAENSVFKKDDLFVLFGELFGRGYANGLVQEAKQAGMRILGITVGRRDGADKSLRPLTAEEQQQVEANLGGQVINIPLEAGFDMEEPEGGRSIVECFSEVNKENWQDFTLDSGYIARCRAAGEHRFTTNLSAVAAQIEQQLMPGQNVFFAHTMAGGVPRAKIFLALANRVFKGKEARHMSSRVFWNSGIGRIAEASFEAVTADTFSHLIQATAGIRERVEQSGGQVRYTAYGYHGTEILVNGSYTWQTYTPYQQGHAKKKLEDYARHAREQGIIATVYNCPEIRTNSSDVFSGVELSLFPLLQSLQAGPPQSSDYAQQQWDICAEKLAEGKSLEFLFDLLNEIWSSEPLRATLDFNHWPQENNPELSNLVIGTSEQIIQLHKSRKDLISDHLSSLVLEASGKLIFHQTGNSSQPVYWIGHRAIAAKLLQLHGA